MAPVDSASSPTSAVTFPGGCHIFPGSGGEVMGLSAGPVRPDSEDTRRLLDAAAGDPAAVGELLARERTILREFVELHLDRGIRHRVDPSDLVQEAQAELVRRFPDFLARRPMPFHLWARRTWSAPRKLVHVV